MKKDIQCCIDNNIYRQVNSEIVAFALISLMETYIYSPIMEQRYSKETIRESLRDLIRHGLLARQNN